PRHNITDAGFDAIERGMTEPDVIAILGVPHGQYYVGTAYVLLPFGPVNSLGSVVTDHLEEGILSETITFNGGQFLFHPKGWVCEDRSILIWFDEAGMVKSKQSYSVTPIRRSVPGSIWHWISN